MSEAASQLNIYQRLAKIRDAVDILQKDKSGYGYNYLSSEEILPRVKALMKKYSVSLVPKIVPQSREVIQYHYADTKTTKSGEPYEKHVNEIMVHADMEFMWVCDDNPTDSLSVPWIFVGQQTDASQAFGSGLSYATRYFLIDYFNIATTNDDPEMLRKKQQEAEELESKEVVKSIVSHIHELVTTYLKEHEESKAELTELIKRHVVDAKGKASANYNLITDPKVAQRLLQDVVEYTKIEV